MKRQSTYIKRCRWGERRAYPHSHISSSSPVTIIINIKIITTHTYHQYLLPQPNVTRPPPPTSPHSHHHHHHHHPHNPNSFLPTTPYNPHQCRNIPYRRSRPSFPPCPITRNHRPGAVRACPFSLGGNVVLVPFGRHRIDDYHIIIVVGSGSTGI